MCCALSQHLSLCTSGESFPLLLLWPHLPRSSVLLPQPAHLAQPSLAPAAAAHTWSLPCVSPMAGFWQARQESSPAAPMSAMMRSQQVFAGGDDDDSFGRCRRQDTSQGCTSSAAVTTSVFIKQEMKKETLAEDGDSDSMSTTSTHHV